MAFTRAELRIAFFLSHMGDKTFWDCPARVLKSHLCYIFGVEMTDTYLHGTLQPYGGQYYVATCMVHHAPCLLWSAVPSSMDGLVVMTWLLAAVSRPLMLTDRPPEAARTCKEMNT